MLATFLIVEIVQHCCLAINENKMMKHGSYLAAFYQLLCFPKCSATTVLPVWRCLISVSFFFCSCQCQLQEPMHNANVTHILGIAKMTMTLCRYNLHRRDPVNGMQLRRLTRRSPISGDQLDDYSSAGDQLADARILEDRRPLSLTGQRYTSENSTPRRKYVRKTVFIVFNVGDVIIVH